MKLVNARYRRPKDPHVGGDQLALITPPSGWTVPAELPDLRGRVREIAEDLETRDGGLASGRGPGWVYEDGHICGVAWAWEGESIYVPVRHPDTHCFAEDQVKAWMLAHRQYAGIRWVYANAGYDLGWTACAYDLDPPPELDDVIAMAVSVDENRLSYELDELARWRGVERKDESKLREALAAYGYHGKPQSNLWRMPARYVGEYAEVDARATLALAASLRPVLVEEGTEEAYRLEMDLVPMILAMRRRGIRVNVERADQVRTQLIKQRDEVFEQLRSHLNERVGMDEIGRNAWLERVHTAQGIGYPRTAPSKNFPRGQPSFTAGATGWMHKHPHWLPKLIAQADKLNNAATKFVQGFIIDYAHRGRIHASINQYRNEEGGTRTSRFSYSGPALQQMPLRDEMLAGLIRGLFEPDEGELWGDLDYSQQEYRLIVHFAELLDMTGAEKAGARYRADPKTDFHTLVAELTGLERKPAKDTNFAKSYGAGVAKFASMTDKSFEEAKAIMEQYDREMPFVKEMAGYLQNLADARGWIRMLDGARSHFDMWEISRYDLKPGHAHPPYSPTRERLATWATNYAEVNEWRLPRVRRAFTKDALNRLIQGSAARQTKLAMREVWRAGQVPLLQMHDALNCSFAEKRQAVEVADIMRNVVKLRVPMQVDMEFGVNWGRARKVEDKKTKAVLYDASWEAAWAERSAA